MKTKSQGLTPGFDGSEGAHREESRIILGPGTQNNTADVPYRALKTIKTSLAELPREQLLALIGELESIKAEALARFVAPLQAPQNHDELVDIAEASQRLGMSRDYLYRHRNQFSFTRRQGRKVLFSAQGIERHIQQQPRSLSLSSRIEK